MEVFNKLLETIEKGSINNQITITNVEIFVKSWKREAESLQLRKADVIVQSEQLKTCEHNFADVYDHTGTQIIGKKCLNGCGF